MKKSLKLIGVVLIVLLMTGCMKMDANVTVKSDKSVDVTNKIEVDLLEYMKVANSFMDSGQTLTEDDLKKQLDEELNKGSNDLESNFLDDEQRKELEKEGYQVDAKLDKTNYKYIVNMTKHVNNIDEMSVSEGTESNKDGDINFIKTANNTYKVKLDVSNSANLGNEESSGMDMSGVLESFKDKITITYKFNLPNKTISNNATNVSSDGKNLTWELNMANAKDIEFEFAFSENKLDFIKNMSNEEKLGLGLIVGGSLTFVIAIIGLIISNKKKN